MYKETYASVTNRGAYTPSPLRVSTLEEQPHTPGNILLLQLWVMEEDPRGLSAVTYCPLEVLLHDPIR